MDPYYPPIPDCCAYLVAHWRDLGRVTSNGMGATRLSCLEIAAWMALNGHELEPWEVDLLRGMSNAFLAESHAAEEPARPAPWVLEDPELLKAEKAATAKNVRLALRG